MLQEKNFFEGAFNSFVAVFGSMTMLGNIWIYRFYKLFFLGGVAGWSVYAVVRYIQRMYCKKQVALQDKSLSHEETGFMKPPPRIDRFDSMDRSGSIEQSEFINQSGSKIYIYANLIVCGLLPLLLLIWYAYDTDYQDQGRYLMPAVLLIMYGVTKGFEKIAGLFASYHRLINLTLGFLFAGIIASLLWMVYGIAFPIYLDTGMIY
jgi:hypothetical protein